MKIIDYNSNFYPSSLKKIKNPPKKLYAIGNVNLLNTTCFSIVGSRVCSKYGMEMAKFFSKELSFQNLTIVSGMALGIDAISHHSTLNVGGYTIAVLGCGFNKIFPEENIGLLIADDGWIEGVDKPNFEEAARELGGERIKITYLKSAESCTLYVNSPSREVDKITKMAVFSHGIVNEGGTIKLGYSTHNNELDIDKDVIKKWNRSAFRSNAEVYLQSCNLGNSGQSLAKVMSDSLNVIVYAYAGKSDYSYIDYPPTRKILNRTTLELVDAPVVKEMNKLREANKDKGFIPTGAFWPPQAAGFSTKALMHSLSNGIRN